jgi:hypothetical protein
MRRFGITFLTLLCLACVGITGCARTQFTDRDNENGDRIICTLIGCTDGFRVALSAKDDELPDGIYDVWTEIDGGTPEQCRVTVQGSQTNKVGSNCGSIFYNSINGNVNIGEIYFDAHENIEIKHLLITFIKDGQLLEQPTFRASRV